jgi:hypothetical protein
VTDTNDARVLVEQHDQHDEVGKRPCQLIDFVDDDDIDQAGSPAFLGRRRRGFHCPKQTCDLSRIHAH